MSEIDVSKCEYYNFGECNRYDFPLSCTKCSDCYYKQLQQLNAELQAYKDKVKPVNFVDSDEYLKVVVENKQLKTENEKLKKDNNILKDILSYPKYTNENAYNELLKSSRAQLIKMVIESHQHGENTSQVVYRQLKEKKQ